MKEDCRDAGPPKYTDSFWGRYNNLIDGNYPIEISLFDPRDFKSAETILKEFSKVLSVEVETLVGHTLAGWFLITALGEDLKLKKFKGRTKDFQKRIQVWRPKAF